MSFIKIIDISNLNNNSLEAQYIKKLKKNVQNYTIFKNSIKEPKIKKREFNSKLVINTDGNIFEDRKNKKNLRTDKKKYNLKNYLNIINKRKNKYLSTYEEECEENVLKNFFDLLKYRAKKKELKKFNTLLNFRNRNKDFLTTNKFNYNYTNPDSLKLIEKTNYSNNLNIKKIKPLKKKELSYNSNIYINNSKNEIKDISISVENQKDLEKNMKYKKSENNLPYITGMRNNFKNLFLKINDMNNNIEKIKINSNKKKNNEKINNTFNDDKKSLIKKNLNIKIIYNKENKNFLRNKNYLKEYVKKLSNYKFKYNSINKFLKRREKQMKINNNYYFSKNKEKEESLFGKENKVNNDFNKIKLINRVNEFKNRIRGNDDSDIFEIFNQNN